MSMPPPLSREWDFEVDPLQYAKTFLATVTRSADNVDGVFTQRVRTHPISR